MKIGITTDKRHAGQAKFSFANGWTAAATVIDEIAVWPTTMTADNYDEAFFMIIEVNNDLEIVQQLYAIAQRPPCKFKA